MGLVANCEKLLLKSSILIRKNMVSLGEMKNIIRKRNLWESVELTPAQEKEIQDYYKNEFGKKIPTWWHRLYQSYLGVYCAEYFPEILLSAYLEPKLNNYRDAAFLEDKNLLEVLFCNIKEVRVPQTYGSCIHGSYRNICGQLVNKDTFCREIENLGQCVLKKTIDTSSGRDVMLCEFTNGIDKRSNRKVVEVISEFGENFLIQEKIVQHQQLQTLYPKSVNTFRVMSYICDNQVKVCPTTSLRLGRNNADRDNLHYGGIGIGIAPNGRLRKYAFSEFGEKFDTHPDTGVVFENFAIPDANKLVTAAIALHSRVPYLGLISWDLTFDENENVVIIESNTSGQAAWLPQMVNGEPLFGEDTRKMLRLIRKGS